MEAAETRNPSQQLVQLSEEPEEPTRRSSQLWVGGPTEWRWRHIKIHQGRRSQTCSLVVRQWPCWRDDVADLGRFKMIRYQKTLGSTLQDLQEISHPQFQEISERRQEQSAHFYTKHIKKKQEADLKKRCRKKACSEELWGAWRDRADHKSCLISEAGTHTDTLHVYSPDTQSIDASCWLSGVSSSSELDFGSCWKRIYAINLFFCLLWSNRFDEK